MRSMVDYNIQKESNLQRLTPFARRADHYRQSLQFNLQIWERLWHAMNRSLRLFFNNKAVLQLLTHRSSSSSDESEILAPTNAEEPAEGRPLPRKTAPPQPELPRPAPEESSEVLNIEPNSTDQNSDI
ncbi:hypothetical protein GPALN_004526 [Globodera pallida]|nr:hypothetical protein GPALN_004526 [Globodera pallida]